jgi:hypothetical protein
VFEVRQSTRDFSLLVDGANHRICAGRRHWYVGITFEMRAFGQYNVVYANFIAIYTVQFSSLLLPGVSGYPGIWTWIGTPIVLGSTVWVTIAEYKRTQHEEQEKSFA